MPHKPQDFAGTECNNLITQGDVVLENRYVRTTLIEETLDEQMLSWERDDGTLVLIPAVAILGLPISVISPDEGHDTTAPQKITKGRKQRYVGTDRVILPGMKEPKPPRTILRVEASELADKLKNDERLKTLSSRQVEILRQRGELNLARKSGVPLTVQLYERPSANVVASKIKLPATPQDTSAVTSTVAFSSHPGFLFRHLLETAFGGDETAAIRAFLADPRSGDAHDSSLPQSDVIKSLDDNTFNVLFYIIKETMDWKGEGREARKHALPQFSIGLVQVFKQTQRLKGFSRGRLIESVTLGPEETVSVEVFTYDRTLEQREDTRSTEVTSEMERTRNQSQTIDLTNSIENTVGASVGAELGVSLPIEAVSVDASVNNDVSAEITTRNQTTANLLTEASSRAAETYKATHQVKTLTRRETGTETRTTRTFSNPNLGRTLNLHHFEVVGHYETTTMAEEDPQFCLLVETPQIGPFDRDWIRAHHDFLDDVLKHDVYREGLQAANMLAAQEWLDELAAAEKRAQEEEKQRQAELEAETPPDNYLPNKGIFATAKRLREKLELFTGMGSVEDAVLTLADHVNPFTGISTNRLVEAEDLISRWAWWTQFGAAYPGTPEAAKAYIEAYDSIAGRTSDPKAPDDMIQAVGEFVDRFDDDWLMGLKLFGTAYILAELMVLPAMTNPALYLYIMKLLYTPNDRGIPKTISSARADFAQHKAKQSAETLVPPAPKQEKLKPENLPPKPPRAFSEKDLAQAHANMGRLILHLEANTAHYNNEYYNREDPALRIDRLTQMGVARFVGNRLLGFAGTRSIYPLNQQALEEDTRGYLQTLIPKYTDFSVDEATTTFTLPTGGFVSEAVLGECEALEPYLQERRRMDLRTRELQNQLLEKRLLENGYEPPAPGADALDGPADSPAAIEGPQ